MDSKYSKVGIVNIHVENWNVITHFWTIPIDMIRVEISSSSFGNSIIDQLTEN